MTLEELDEDNPKWLVNEQIKGLLEGLGASEDHEGVLAFLRSTGLPEGTVRRVHRAIVHGDTKVLPPAAPSEVAAAEDPWEKAKCEICGAPAVAQVYDILQYVETPSGVTKARHYGGPHLFCKAHTRESHWREMGPIYPPPT